MHPVLILFPALVFFLLILIFIRRVEIREIAEAFIKAQLVIFTFIAVSTEFLSLIQEISFQGILSAWILFLLICLIITIIYFNRRRQSLIFPAFQKIKPFTAILIGSIFLILISTLITGFLYPPNNWDSMTYHMSKVVHWINNQDLSFYPTHITRQNFQMPLAEFAIMHLQVLTGFDGYAFLVQWISFPVLICFGLLIAAEFGLTKKQQLLSALVIATLPMTILQASSTQNDLVVSGFVVLFALFMIRLHKKFNAENFVLAAVSLGLALLTKGTAYLYCAGIGTALAIPILMKYRNDRRRFLKAASALLLIVIVALSLNTGHLWRNYKLYGYPLSTEGEEYKNTDLSLIAFLTNTSRNVASHLATPSDHVNEFLKRTLHITFGSHLNNPQTTWHGSSFDIRYKRHEDTAGNLIHMLIVLFSMIVLPILWYRDRYQKIIWYAIGILLGAILYAWILRWHPWSSRLHTPLFVLASPIFAIALTAKDNGIWKYLSKAIITILVLYSLIFVFGNKSRSLISFEWNDKERIELYFLNRQSLHQDYEIAIKILQDSGVEEAGLFLDSEDWEYPFWVIANRTENNARTINFRHVGVENISKEIDKSEVLPKYIIATKNLENWELATKYTMIYSSDNVSVFMKLE